MNNNCILCGWPSNHSKFQEINFLVEECNEPCILYDWFGIIEPIFGAWDFSIKYWNQSTSVQVCFRYVEEVQNELFQSKKYSFPFKT